MQAELDGTIRAVTRNRRGVMWCPFCDRSSQNIGSEQFCDGCHARFTDDAVEESPVSEEAPRRRGRPPQTPAEEVAVEEPSEEAESE